MSLWRRVLLIVLGCAVMAAIGAVVGVAVSAGPLGITVLLVLTTGTLIGALLLERWRRSVATRAFRAAYPGKDLLLVYTDSPHWLSHIEEHWVPQWRERVELLNRSRRWSATQLEARLWRVLGGSREHTPLAIVVSGGGRPQVIRFWLAFRDQKHGKPHSLQMGEAQLRAAMEASRP